MDETVTTTLSDGIMTAVNDVFSVMGVAFEQIIENPVLMLFLGASVIGVGIGIFKGLRSAV